MMITSDSVSTNIVLKPIQRQMKKTLLTIVLVTQDNNKVSSRQGNILLRMLSKDGQKVKNNRCLKTIASTQATNPLTSL